MAGPLGPFCGSNSYTFGSTSESTRIALAPTLPARRRARCTTCPRLTSLHTRIVATLSHEPASGSLAERSRTWLVGTAGRCAPGASSVVTRAPQPPTTRNGVTTAASERKRISASGPGIAGDDRASTVTHRQPAFRSPSHAFRSPKSMHPITFANTYRGRPAGTASTARETVVTRRRHGRETGAETNRPRARSECRTEWQLASRSLGGFP